MERWEGEYLYNQFFIDQCVSGSESSLYTVTRVENLTRLEQIGMKAGREWCLGEAERAEIVGGEGAEKDAPHWIF